MNDNIFNYKYTGFFLIELLIAIGIFSITCLLFLKLHNSIIIQQKEVQKHIEAIDLASSLIEEINAFKISLIQDLKIKDFKISVKNIETFFNSNSKAQKYAKKFELKEMIVSWFSNEKERHIKLTFGIMV